MNNVAASFFMAGLVTVIVAGILIWGAKAFILAIGIAMMIGALMSV